MKLLLTAPRDNRWGHQISFWDWETRSVNGHLTPLPQDDDMFGREMKSGRIAVFKLCDIKPCGNPPDMFFAMAEDVGYLDELENQS